MASHRLPVTKTTFSLLITSCMSCPTPVHNEENGVNFVRGVLSDLPYALWLRNCPACVERVIAKKILGHACACRTVLCKRKEFFTIITAHICKNVMPSSSTYIKTLFIFNISPEVRSIHQKCSIYFSGIFQAEIHRRPPSCSPCGTLR